MSELERWETRFGAPGYMFGKEPNAFLKAQARRLRGLKTALSVADGEGRNGVWLAEQGLDVLAVDFSRTALVKAHALAQERGVRLRTEVADVANWRWPKDAFDVIVAIFIAVPVAERGAFCQPQGCPAVGWAPAHAELSPRTTQLSYRGTSGRRAHVHARAPRSGLR